MLLVVLIVVVLLSSRGGDMRVSLPLELRRRFKIVWEILPGDVQRGLKEYIRDVRAVEALKNATVKCTSGLIKPSVIEGFGWCVLDDPPSRVFIRFKKNLESETELRTVGVILHELAHAYEHLQDNWRAEGRWEDRSETAAWAQVIAWVARDAYKPSLGGYKAASEIAGSAQILLMNEWTKWHLRELLSSE